jgi:virginiamycin B lyase
MNKRSLILITGIGIVLIFVLFVSLDLFSSDESDMTLTGTPADNFSEDQRSKFCGTGNATSTNYVKEYKIPTDCTLPQAIVTDPQGNIWFVESNTGNLAKFDPVLKSFTEYENSFWPKSEHSMMWGMDYSPDGTIWFTEEKYKSVWKFNIQDEKYQRIPFPSDDNSYPQRLEIHGSKLIINDFKGNKITFSDYASYGEDVSQFTPQDESSFTYSIPSNVPNGVIGDFTIEGKNIWYTNWVLDGPGVLSKINQTEFELAIQNEGDNISFDFLSLPADLNTPNGITADNNGNIWIVDSSSSSFFKFNPITENFTQYTTSNPHKSTYGNYTGEIKSPVSRPYWIETDSFGKLVFNEQGSNSIGVFDPDSESLVEYFIPSKNPNWGDCGDVSDCGLSQVFDFVINENYIWFTEWSENNIGVVDTTISLPVEIHLDEDKILLHPGESKNLNFSISASENILSSVSFVLSSSSDFLNVQTNDSLENLLPNSIESIDVTLHAEDKLIPGEYKVLLGVATDQVSVSKFVTVIVESSTISLFESIALDDSEIQP